MAALTGMSGGDRRLQVEVDLLWSAAAGFFEAPGAQGGSYAFGVTSLGQTVWRMNRFWLDEIRQPFRRRVVG